MLKLLVFNTSVICMMIPVMEHYLGRTLPPGADMIFFWVGATGLVLLGVTLGLLRLSRLR